MTAVAIVSYSFRFALSLIWCMVRAHLYYNDVCINWSANTYLTWQAPTMLFLAYFEGEYLAPMGTKHIDDGTTIYIYIYIIEFKHCAGNN